MSNAETIEVTGKADLGYSPHFRCEIRAGEKYTIAPEDYTPELFEPIDGLPTVTPAYTGNEQESDGGASDE